jgi:hypothetical protein
MPNKRYKNGKSYDFTDWTITHLGKDKDNPDVFPYPKDKPVAEGLSIRVHKVIARGKFRHIEIACYNQAFDSVADMELQPGEMIHFFGRYEKEKGKKLDFEKVAINLPLQVDRAGAERTAKASEI